MLSFSWGWKLGRLLDARLNESGIQWHKASKDPLEMKNNVVTAKLGLFYPDLSQESV
jgi:hypothetical protein